MQGGAHTEIDIKPIISRQNEDTSFDDCEAGIPTPKLYLPEAIVTPVTTKQGKTSLPEPNGIKPRKPCNCTKSQCLKLLVSSLCTNMSLKSELMVLT